MTILLGILSVLVVGAGCGIGAAARWAVRESFSRALDRRESPSILLEVVPWPTMIANVVACFLLGIVVTRIGAEPTGGVRYLFLLLGAGVCGGLSTLAGAALDAVQLARRGTPVISVGYLLVTAALGMAALWLGVLVTQGMGSAGA
ncbi:CrcB family protein [Brachybacterium sp. ACRRE]|uniref:fluoride efflux transporter FluC n=1 Tax=Brachybacterium sp. ACRRE TaxID=2918184 RepID=UPI001EF25013|nr:CrcB family protein [Brachybacterium sp. ACRRE]MCG7310039.1 CrcB family protein [Brachybacterium sp. ACRRE]